MAAVAVRAVRDVRQRRRQPDLVDTLLIEGGVDAPACHVRERRLARDHVGAQRRDLAAPFPDSRAVGWAPWMLVATHSGVDCVSRLAGEAAGAGLGRGLLAVSALLDEGLALRLSGEPLDVEDEHLKWRVCRPERDAGHAQSSATGFRENVVTLRRGVNGKGGTAVRDGGMGMAGVGMEAVGMGEGWMGGVGMGGARKEVGGKKVGGTEVGGEEVRGKEL